MQKGTTKKNKPAKCNRKPYNVKNPELIKLLETGKTANPTEIFSNNKINKKAQQENETPTPPEKEPDEVPATQATDIKPEERFEEIPNDES